MISRPRVYFVRPIGQEGPVKIGFSEIPHDRLVALRSWSPVPLEMIAELPGGQELERRFHALFKADALHGEWFAYSDGLGRVIAEVQAGTFDVTTLPAPICLNANAKGKKWSPEARLAHALNQRINRLRQNRIDIPGAVQDAMWRFCPPRRYCKPRDASGLSLVQEFLAEHGYTPLQFPPAAA